MGKGGRGRWSGIGCGAMGCDRKRGREEKGRGMVWNGGRVDERITVHFAAVSDASDPPRSAFQSQLPFFLIPVLTSLNKTTTSRSSYSFGRFVTNSLQFRISNEGGRAVLTFRFLGPKESPFIFSIAKNASSSFTNLTKPYPRLFFVFLSRTTFDTRISPNSANRPCAS